MARPNKTNSAPVAEIATPAVAAPAEQSAPTPEKLKEKFSYFRVKKLSGFLFQALEVEIDEDEIKPVEYGKADLRELVMDKLYPVMVPSIDFKRKK